MITFDEVTLGTHRFPVHTQPFDLTLVPYDSQGQKRMALHILGTHFFEIVNEADLNGLINYREQSLVSESPKVYRGEYLAASLLFKYLEGTDVGSFENLQSIIANYVTDHADEGYELGIHDVDATRILEKLWPLLTSVGLLRFPPLCRSVAQLFWVFSATQEDCKRWERTVKRLSQLHALFGGDREPLLANPLLKDLTPALVTFLREQPIFKEENVSPEWNEWVALRASEYLVEELKNDSLSFTTSTQAQQWVDGFWQALEKHDKRRQFEDDLRAFKHVLPQQLALVQTWLTSSASALEQEVSYYLPEAVTILITGKRVTRRVSSAPLPVAVTDMKGTHPRLQNQTLTVQLDEFFDRLQHFKKVHVPAFQAYQQWRQTFLEGATQRLRVEQFHSQPLPTFVCNHLLRAVHLPIIGDNLAKQLGTVNQPPHPEWIPFLLLLSPPGFGKTQLVEYLAWRLGLLLVTVNGSRLGTAVTSLDPVIAPHVFARQELEKLQFALAIGDNVLLLVDDIQYCHPEFLQALVPLADRRRPMEGVWPGQIRTYDLRETRFGLILAGSLDLQGTIPNLPPALLQRVDICSLGRIPQGQESLFALSYLENALASHPLLGPLILQDESNMDKLIQLAQFQPAEASTPKLSSSLPEEEDIWAILKKLLRLQDIIFKVHQHYWTSMQESDTYRMTPPFQLLGSYRTMNRLTAQVTAEMTDENVEKLVMNHYTKEAQLLTTGREENLLKLAEICGRQTATQAARWAEIMGTFQRWQTLSESTADPVSRVVNQLSVLGERLYHIQTTLSSATDMKQLTTHLAALPNLVQALSNSQLEVNVINQLPSGLEDGLKSMIEMVEKTLLPIVQDYERKSKLDLIIFERVKEMAETLKELQKEWLVKGKVQKQYKPLSFKD